MECDYEQRLIVAQQELRLAQRLLQTEISTYPGPIAGCDAQFNRLLADRQRIHDALAALDAQAFVPTPRQPVASRGMDSR